MSDIPTPQLNPRLIAQVEALLFVAPGSVTVSQLATAMNVSHYLVEKCLEILSTRYTNDETLSGIRIQEHHGRLQMITAPEFSDQIERFLGLDATSRLSRAALETLAIIAYQQPVTRPEIDAIRGVNSDSVLKSLMSKGLVEEVGRTERPGRPILYGSTSDFLQHFGLTSLQDLPPLPTDDNPHTNHDLLADS